MASKIAFATAGAVVMGAGVQDEAETLRVFYGTFYFSLSGKLLPPSGTVDYKETLRVLIEVASEPFCLGICYPLLVERNVIIAASKPLHTPSVLRTPPPNTTI